MYCFLFSCMLLLPYCSRHNDDDYYAGDYKKYARRNHRAAVPVDSVYDQFPSYDSLADYASASKLSCIPCICNGAAYCTMSDTTMIIHSDSLYKALFNGCTVFSSCTATALPQINFTEKTLIGWQMGGGSWLETATYKIVKQDSLYRFIVKMKYDSGCAYTMIYLLRSFWVTVPKLAASDSVSFEQYYFGTYCD